jgi:hypothetical protein
MLTFANFSFPISLLLIPLGIFMLFYLFYSIFNIYHLLRFGVYGFGLYIIATIFTLGTIFFIGTTGFLLIRYDWNAPVVLGEIFQIEETDFSL